MYISLKNIYVACSECFWTHIYFIEMHVFYTKILQATDLSFCIVCNIRCLSNALNY